VIGLVAFGRHANEETSLAKVEVKAFGAMVSARKNENY
jgi:hypothetical protein